MINNAESTPNTSTSNVPNRYSDSKGTGVLSTLVFAIVVTIIMVIVAYFKGV